MSFTRAKAYLTEKGFGDRVIEFETSSATVELAAQAAGVTPGEIAKSLTFEVEGKPVMILCAGDQKIDNPKYKQTFHTKAKMLAFEQVEELIGHGVGGVCPFGINPGVGVYLDESLKEYEIVYPACGSSNSAVKLTIAELMEASSYEAWVDVCK